MKRLNKILCIALVFGLLFAGLVYAEGEEGDTEAEEPASQELRSDDSLYLWIGLAYGSGAVDKITVKSADGFIIVKGNNNGWKETDIKTGATTLTITPSGSQAVLTDPDGNVIRTVSIESGADPV